MLKKTITYTDYDENERTEDFYFNLNKTELLEMNFGVAGGLDQYIKRLVNESDGGRLISTFKEIVLKAYGVKSLDGKQFIKTQELRDAFAQTEAFSDLFMELATDADKAAAFVSGIIPKQVLQNASSPTLISAT